MTPVTQDIFYDPTAPPERQRGNCLSAVIASLLDLPLTEVPNFVQDHVNHEGDRDWDWWVRVMRFLRDHGWGLHSAALETHPDEHLWVSGKSPRGVGIYHAVIYKNGVMAHDPHPDRSGVLDIDSVYGIHRLEDEALRA